MPASGLGGHGGLGGLGGLLRAGLEAGLVVVAGDGDMVAGRGVAGPSVCVAMVEWDVDGVEVDVGVGAGPVEEEEEDAGVDIGCWCCCSCSRVFSLNTCS